MKSNIIKLLLILTFFFSGCTKGNKVESTIEKSFELIIDSLAVNNDSWLEFQVDKSQELDVSFSKGKYIDNSFKITAREYNLDDKPIKIQVTTKSAGSYKFEMYLINNSKDVDIDYSNKSSIEIPNLEFISPLKYYLWLLLIGGILILGILAFLFWRNYNNKNPKFEEGYLNFIFPLNLQIDLTGKRSIDIAEVIESDEFTCVLRCQIDEDYTDGDFIEVSSPILESSDDIILIVNNQHIDTILGEKLKKEDIVVINSSLGDKLVEFVFKK